MFNKKLLLLQRSLSDSDQQFQQLKTVPSVGELLEGTASINISNIIESLGTLNLNSSINMNNEIFGYYDPSLTYNGKSNIDLDLNLDSQLNLEFDGNLNIINRYISNQFGSLDFDIKTIINNTYDLNSRPNLELSPKLNLDNRIGLEAFSNIELDNFINLSNSYDLLLSTIPLITAKAVLSNEYNLKTVSSQIFDAGFSCSVVNNSIFAPNIVFSGSNKNDIIFELLVDGATRSTQIGSVVLPVNILLSSLGSIIKDGHSSLVSDLSLGSFCNLHLNSGVNISSELNSHFLPNLSFSSPIILDLTFDMLTEGLRSAFITGSSSLNMDLNFNNVSNLIYNGDTDLNIQTNIYNRGNIDFDSNMRFSNNIDLETFAQLIMDGDTSFNVFFEINGSLVSLIDVLTSVEFSLNIQREKVFDLTI